MDALETDVMSVLRAQELECRNRYAHGRLCIADVEHAIVNARFGADAEASAIGHAILHSEHEHAPLDGALPIEDGFEFVFLEMMQEDVQAAHHVENRALLASALTPHNRVECDGGIQAE